MSESPSLAEPALAVADSSTSGTLLFQIAQVYPELWEQVAVHPNASPETLEWLDEHGGPEIKAIVGMRRTAPSLSPKPVNLASGGAQSQADRIVPARKKSPWIALFIALFTAIALIPGVSGALYVKSHPVMGIAPSQGIPVPGVEPLTPWITPSPPPPPPPDCGPEDQIRVSWTLGIDFDDTQRAVSLIKARVNAAGFSSTVKANNATDISVDICQNMTDDDIAWLTPWLTNSGEFSIRQVLGQLNPNNSAITVPAPGYGLSGVDADLAAKLEWRPSAADLNLGNDPDWCDSHPEFIPLDHVVQAGFVCDPQQQLPYLLGPSLLDGSDVASAYLPDGTEMAVLEGPSIMVKLTDQGNTLLRDSTQYIKGQKPPQNMTSIVLSGVSLGSGLVMDSISGPVNIGTYSPIERGARLTERDAPMLAAVIGFSQIPIHIELLDCERVG